MKELYLLSGLGADKRVFEFLNLPDFKFNHIEWIDPLPHESLSHYAKRLSAQIHSPEPILIGVSFGGMIAVEIGKIISTKKIILISSAQTKNDVPLPFRAIGKLRINKLFPPKFFTKVNPTTYWLFGAETDQEKKLLKAIMSDTDTKFLTWAIDKIMHWKNKAFLPNVTTIHGSNDKVLPFTQADFCIRGGSHLMIINRADEISLIIKQVLA
jgi:esterase/lipase